jgi:hypothetical protein
MTDGTTPTAAPAERPAPRAARPAGRGKPAMWPTVFASLACFLVVFEFLAFRLTSGNDPALGASQVTASPPPRATVVDRKLIKTTVVHDPARQGRPVSSVSDTASSGSPAPATTAATPAPATVPAPAPAPEPAAPVSTSAS